MTNDVARIEKMQKCVSIDFHAKDVHGDTIFVTIEGTVAQDILDIIKSSISKDITPPKILPGGR